MYEQFLKNVLLREKRKDLDSRNLLWDQNLKTLRTVVFAVFGISLYWMTADRLLDSYNLSTAARAGVIAQLSASCYMLWLAYRRGKRNYRLVRFSFLFFYMVLIIGISLLTLGRNIDIVAQGSYSPHIGVSVSTFYLFLMAAMPMAELKDQIFLCIFMFVGLLAPDIFVLSSAYSLLSHLVLCSCFSAVILFFRSMFLQNAVSTVEIEKLSEKLTSYSYCDSLTGALNRRAMDEYLAYLQKKPGVRQAGVIFFDADYFKKYNDRYGHVQGDEALRLVVRYAQESLGADGSSYLFRYGGEEFIILMENPGEKKLLETMGRLKDDIYDANIPREDVELFDRLTITAGGALEEVPSKTGDYVLAADTQLYLGKAAYRNAAYYRDRKVDVGRSNSRNVYEQFSVRRQSKAWLFENEFEPALKKGEFKVFCQPKYDAQDSCLNGAEALVRWQKPGGVLISPGEFIPVFEADGLIAKLDEFVFSTVCHRQRELLDKGLVPVPVSVNMSRATLFSPGTVERYGAILRTSGISADLVPLEITESTEAESSVFKKLILDLKSEGFSLYMDDFGSGYFSLANLCELPFDMVKLDKSLADNIGNLGGDEILKHIIELSHFMNMEVAAEGVENQEQLNFLKKLNCDTIQGFYFSRPLPYESYLELLTEENTQRILRSKQELRTREGGDLGSLRITNDLKLTYLTAMSSIYMTIHVIDLEKDTTTEFATTTNVKEHVNQVGHATRQMRQAMMHTVSPEDIEANLAFTDLTTLKERMKGQRSMYRDFRGVHFPWFRAQFIEVSRDENGAPAVVIFTTQVIRSEKKVEKEEEESRTDVLTGVFSWKAFIEDCEKFRERAGKEDPGLAELSVFTVQVKDLEETEKRQGNAAGDELVWGAADCLTRVFGKQSQIYRTDKGRFTVVFDRREKLPEGCRSELKRVVSEWMGNLVKHLKISCGTVNAADWPGLSLEQLAEKSRETEEAA